jgi:hypothetical protein
MIAANLKNARAGVLSMALALGQQCVLCFQSSAQPPASGAQAPDVAPHPDSAIAFDQIDRLLLYGQSPPPIDSFAADAATIASLQALKTDVPGKGSRGARTATNILVSSALNLVPIAGPLIAGAASNAMGAAEQAANRHAWEEHHAAVARFISAGTLSRFAFSNSWLRCERGHEVTIIKPDQGLTFILDTAKKTVQTIDVRTSPETIEVDTTATLPPSLAGKPVTERLPDATIAGLTVHGYRTIGTIELKQSLGWCNAGPHPVIQVEYVTDLPDPQPAVDLPAAQGLADGCSPSSAASYQKAGLLVLYRATTTDPDTPNSVSVMFERGNIRRLNEGDAAFFSVPEGFSKEQ